MGNTAGSRRLAPEVRREEILAAATELISRVGFASASLDDFADAAAISKSGLLHYFPSKDRLLAAVLGRRDEVDVATVFRDIRLDTPAKARATLAELVARNRRQPQIVQLFAILSAEALAVDHPAHDHFRRRTEWIRAHLREKVLAWHPDPDSAAIQVMSFLDGLQMAWLRDPTIDSSRHWDRFADGLFGAPSDTPRDQPT